MMRPSTSGVRRWVMYWAVWTGAGLFYLSQDFMTRLSRNERIPWGNLVIGWMSAMYICAAFTPLILWLGRRWVVDNAPSRGTIALHLGASIAFSLVSTVLEVPLLVALGLLPAVTGLVSFKTALWYLLPYDFHGGIIRYWAVVGVQALFRSNQEARRREREALE